MQSTENVSPTIPENWSEMTAAERAKHLLSAGVTAQIDINPTELAPEFVAYSCQVKLMPAGFHQSKESAIEAGIKWLQSIASNN